MQKIYRAAYRSPIGVVEIKGTETEIHSVDFAETSRDQARPKKSGRTRGRANVSPAVRECVRQLDEYFRGTRKTFSLRLSPAGTRFQKEVWNALRNVGYGRTASYSDIARAVGRPLASRAVGQANRRNPLGIIVPCHRIIGSGGGLVGYGGGLWRKEWLLAHERKAKDPKAKARS
jgi:methylated-DNA-[protein]-cysteine S-methyltransferase